MAPKAPRPVWRTAAGIDKGQQHCLDITAIQNAQALAHLRQQRAVERYAGIDHELLAALGTDRFPASPMRIVEGAR